MSLINFKSVLFCSSEDSVHCAKNLLKSDQNKKWLSSKGTAARITCILEFEKPCLITSVEFGNDGSALIELLVSQSSKPDYWVSLLPETILMTIDESRANKNRNQTKTFTLNDLNKTCLNEKWDRLRVVCEQKFNSLNQFGISFIKLYSAKDNNEIEQEKTKLGSSITEQSLKPVSNDNQKFSSSDSTEELLNRTSLNNNGNSTLKTNDSKKDKSQLMQHVTFVLSGFLNPLRSELRNKALAMGATYNDDWNDACTHLISAFSNTPKYHEVLQTGKGFIVSKHWILDCYKQSQLLPENSYELKHNDNNEIAKQESEANKRKSKAEEEDTDANGAKSQPTEKTPARAKGRPKKKIKFGELPDIFHGKHFYVSYGDYDDHTLLDIARIVLAYDGTLEKQITSDVKYVITNRMWNLDFAKISKANPDINFVTLDWLQDCHDAEQFVPMQPHLVLP